MLVLLGQTARAVILRQKPLGHMQLVVRIDADQMSIEDRVVNLRQRDSVGTMPS